MNGSLRFKQNSILHRYFEFLVVEMDQYL